jgi:hypothetical protein
MKKKLNYANLPVLAIMIIIAIFSVFVDASTENLAEMALIGLSYLLILGATALICPISLIFQIRNKDKTILDKVLLVINVLMSILGIVLIIFIFAK